MHILPLQLTHSFPNCVPSLLDLILISSSDHVEKHGQCSADAFSYHGLISLTGHLQLERLEWMIKLLFLIPSSQVFLMPTPLYFSYVLSIFQLHGLQLTSKLCKIRKTGPKGSTRRIQNSTNWEMYKKARNRCNIACRDALRRHIHKSVSVYGNF